MGPAPFTRDPAAARPRAKAGRRKDGQRGAVAVEFVLIAVAMATMLLAMADVGMAAFQYITLNQALGSAGEFVINHSNRYADISNIVKASLPSGWTDVTVGSPRFFCQSGNYSCSSPPPSGQTAPLSAATCDAQGQGVYLTASRPNTTILLSALGNTVNACYVGRFQ